MSKGADFGTEKDGSKSKDYCGYCYRDGEWTNPNATMEQMLEIGLKGINESAEMNKVAKFFIKKMYPAQLKRLTRWQNKP
jgi:hypothetical protein